MSSHKLLDLNGSIGPPSGQQQPNETMALVEQNNQSSFKDTFKNPWTTIPRPMNHFAEISQVQYDRQEDEKKALQRVLQDQIDEKKIRINDERRRLVEEEQRFEAKLLKDRDEMANRERIEKEEADNKIKKARHVNQQVFEAKKVVVPSIESQRSSLHKLNISEIHQDHVSPLISQHDRVERAAPVEQHNTSTFDVTMLQ